MHTPIKMKKVKFLYNPNSGDKKIVNKIDLIIKKYQDYGYTVFPVRLCSNISINESLDDLDESFDHILIAGGDGTLNKVINCIKDKDFDIPIAILPTGTANDFAKVLDIPMNIDKAIDKILTSNPKKIDLGKINDNYFANIASIGMFTEVSQKTNPHLKNSLGKYSYILKGVEDAVNLKYHEVEIETDDMKYKGNTYLTLVLNGRTAGNLNLAHNSLVDDGVLDVIIFEAMPFQKTIPILLDVIVGSSFVNHSGVICFQAKKIKITSPDDISTDIDGEKGPKLPLEINCIKDSIQVLGIK